MAKRLILLSTLFFCITAIAAQAATYYVDKNSIGGKCSDFNNGTSTTTPWCTLGKANSSVAPGDTVYVRAANYYETLSLSKSGTAGNFITWQNYPGETPIIDGRNGSNGTWQGIVNANGASYWKLIGFEIRNYDELVGVYEDSHHFEIRNNIIHTSGTSSCVIIGNYTHDYLLDGNDIYDCKYAESPGLEAVRIMENTYNFMVSNNKVHDSDYIGNNVVGRTRNGLPQKGVVRGNTLSNNGTPRGGHDIYVDSANGIVVEGNRSTNHFDTGITLQAEERVCANTKNIIRKNITIGSPHSITI